MSDGHFYSQSDFDSQTFLRRQTYLLKGLLRDKGGGGVAGCRVSVIRRWLVEQEDAAGWIEKQFAALVQTYEALLSEPRLANLKRVKGRGKPPQLQWRVAQENGNQGVVSLFDPESDANRELLRRLPPPVFAAMLEIEIWRVTLNYLSNLQQWVTQSTSDVLGQLETLQVQRTGAIDFLPTQPI